MSNPYAPPQSNVEGRTQDPSQGELVLASLLMRFLGNLIDTVFLLIPFFAAFYFLGYWDEIMDESKLVLSEEILISVFGFFLFTIINGYFIYTRGQTIGKLICRTRVVMIDGSPVSGNRYLFVRYLPMYVATQIPFAGGFISLLDSLFIFRKERNCLHDDIAGTRVVVVD